MLTHETIGSRNSPAGDFPDKDALGRDAGDLEPIDICLIVSPGHAEDVPDLGSIAD